MSLPPTPVAPTPVALEFFAGGGLARLGLAEQFDVAWANDIDRGKADAWRSNFGDTGFVLGDIHDLDPLTLPKADLAWASFPCQDLSLAGSRAGLGGKRSGTFFGFIHIIKGLQANNRAPKILVIENVSGLMTSRGGQDFAVLMQAIVDLGYQAGALEIDARHFVPQSRPRVFIVACAKAHFVPSNLSADHPEGLAFVTPAILKAWHALPPGLAKQHIWWKLPSPPQATQTLSDIIDPTDQNWWPQAKTDALVDSLSARHRAKLCEIQAKGSLQFGAVYRRTRTRDGVARPFAEIRFDGLAGCLRTPSGGSSRQFLLSVRGSDIAARALNPREAMRLMGVEDSYILPKRELAGLKVAGDGVVVPLVAWLSGELLGPLVKGNSQSPNSLYKDNNVD